MDLTDDQIDRYARHLILPEIGGPGQAKLLQSSALVVGAGGLGAPLLMYLAAAGFGRLGIVDDDVVDLSNLQRQVIHDTSGLGTPKVTSAANRVAVLNPDIAVEEIGARLTVSNAADLVASFDLVIDGSDNFATRYLLNDACYLAGKPLISAALLRFEGQLSVFRAHEGPPHPCYRCLFPEPPPPDAVPNCAEAGVLGALAGVVGSLQAVESVKTVLDLGESLSGRLLLYDALSMRFTILQVPRDPACPLCGPKATIKDLSAHH
ncbi:MAG: molybdopterin-synthase adenylyltransferase MoeB [Pseudomonadota bacterium]